MYVNTVTISSKGQIVLPKIIRKFLNTNTIMLEIDAENKVTISPIRHLAGSLSSYKKDIVDTSFDKVRSGVWKECLQRYKNTES